MSQYWHYWFYLSEYEFILLKWEMIGNEENQNTLIYAPVTCKNCLSHDSVQIKEVPL